MASERQEDLTPVPPAATTTPPPTLAPAPIPSQTSPSVSVVGADAARLDQMAADVDSAARSESWDHARAGWKIFEDRWLDVEDGFRALSRDAYRDIELGMRRVSDLLQPASPDVLAVRREIAGLRDVLRPFIASPGAPTPSPRPAYSAFSYSAPAYASPTSRPPVAGPTAIPDSCLTPSLTITPPSLRSGGVLQFRARGFKPGTVVSVVVYGPVPVGSVFGPLVHAFEHQPVDRSCSATSDEGIPAEALFEDNPTLPTGSYVLVVAGIRWAPRSSPESDARVHAPFNYYVVRR